MLLFSTLTWLWNRFIGALFFDRLFQSRCVLALILQRFSSLLVYLQWEHDYSLQLHVCCRVLLNWWEVSLYNCWYSAVLLPTWICVCTALRFTVSICWIRFSILMIQIHLQVLIWLWFWCKKDWHTFFLLVKGKLDNLIVLWIQVLNSSWGIV